MQIGITVPDIVPLNEIKVSIGLGDVLLSALRSNKISAESGLDSGMGNVEASLGCSEKDCAYDVETGMGNVTVNGRDRGGEARQKGDRSCRLDAESGMGDVNVSFTAD